METILLLIMAGGIYWLYKNRERPSVQRNDWVRKFSVYYATNALCLYGSSSGEVPEQLVGLMDPRIAGDAQQSFIASLGNYLRHECKRNIQPGDYRLALADIRKLLSSNVQWANSHAAIGPFIRAMHKEETGTDISEAELAAHRDEIIEQARTDEEAAAIIMARILRFNMEATFHETFGMRYHDYLRSKYPTGARASLSAAVQTQNTSVI